MLINENLTSCIQLHLKVLNFYGKFPYSFEKKTCRLHCSDTRTTRNLKFRAFLLFIICAIVWFQIYFSWGKFSIVVTYEAVIDASSQLVFVTFILVYLQRRHLVTELFNMLAQLDRKLEAQNLSGPMNRIGKQLVIFLQQCALSTAPVAICGYVLRMWKRPCGPSTIAFMYLPQCIHSSQNSLSEILPLTIISGICFMALIHCTGGYMFFIIQLSYIQCCCLRNYLKGIFKAFCERQRHRRRNSLQEFNKKLGLLKIYQQLQILVGYYNNIQQDVAAICVLCFSGFVLVLCLYAVIQYGSSLTLIQLVIFCCIAQDAILVVVVMFGAYGGLFADSKAFVEYLSFNYSAKNMRQFGSRYFQKIVWSLVPLKVKCGSFTHVKKLTPMKTIQVCVDMLVNLLIANPT